MQIAKAKKKTKRRILESMHGKRIVTDIWIVHPDMHGKGDHRRQIYSAYQSRWQQPLVVRGENRVRSLIKLCMWDHTRHPLLIDLTLTIAVREVLQKPIMIVSMSWIQQCVEKSKHDIIAKVDLSWPAKPLETYMHCSEKPASTNFSFCRSTSTWYS